MTTNLAFLRVTTLVRISREYPASFRGMFCAVFGVFLLTACSSTKTIDIETRFPVPVMQKAPVHMGLLLDQELVEFTYTEEIEGKGSWNVPVGAVQQEMFANLSSGMFRAHSFVAGLEADAAEQVDGVLKPAITDLQFSLPEQTRSNFYEVWIRYTFQLFDADGNLVAEWPLPAYGKANKQDFGSASRGVTAAAVAACRDAMAFFAIHFAREPAIEQWLQRSSSLPPASTPTGTAAAAAQTRK